MHAATQVPLAEVATPKTRGPARHVAVLAAALFACSTPVSQAQAGQATSKCNAPEFRQFDFWIGSWDVYENNKLVGTNVIERILEGCVLHETWTGAGQTLGQSFSAYDGSRKVWHQTWVDNAGSVLLLEGMLRNGRMILQGPQTDAATGLLTRERITWSREAGGTIRQLWESSADGEKTWKTQFNGHYIRRGAIPPAPPLPQR